MKTVIPLIILLILSSCATKKNATKNNEADFTLWRITKELENKNLNYISLKKSCAGEKHLKKQNSDNCAECLSHYDTYIFWKENKKLLIQKNDNCSEFYPIEFTDFDPIEYLYKNQTKLIEENIGQYKIDDDSYSIITHSCNISYYIRNENKTFLKEFELYDLETSEDSVNLNYESNNRLAIIILHKKLIEIIDDLETEKKFERNRKTCYNTVYN